MRNIANINYNIDYNIIYDESMIYRSFFNSSLQSFVFENKNCINNFLSLIDNRSIEEKDELFITNNFEKQNKSISYGRDVLDCIAQTEKHSYEESISEYISEIRNIILHDEFFDGELSMSEQYMIEAKEQGNLTPVLDALMRIYISSLDNVHILEGILAMISCVPYDVVEPSGQVMAMGLLTNKVLFIRDKAIQCFERWNSKKGLSVLKNIKCSPRWLQTYVDKVTMYIERYGIN